LVDIPHLSYLAVPKLSTAVFRVSTATTNQGTNSELDDADSTISNGSSAADDEVSSILSPPLAIMRQTRAMSTPSSTSSRNTPAGKAGLVNATKVHLLESHLQALEKLQIEAAAQQKEKHVRDERLALTVELKTVEEMLVMKKNELKAFDSDVDSDSEKEFVCNQIKKLRKKQRTLTALVYASDDEDKL
jgi:hypothetical protein